MSKLNKSIVQTQRETWGKDKLILIDSVVCASEKIVHCFPHTSDLYQNYTAGFSELSIFYHAVSVTFMI